MTISIRLAVALVACQGLNVLVCGGGGGVMCYQTSTTHVTSPPREQGLLPLIPMQRARVIPHTCGAPRQLLLFANFIFNASITSADLSAAHMARAAIARASRMRYNE